MDPTWPGQSSGLCTSGTPWWEHTGPLQNNAGSHHSANEQQPYGFPRGLFPCPQCSKVYQYKYTLATHLRFECGKEPQFQCPYCPHRTKLKGNLMKHVRKIHANVISSDSSHILHPPLQNPVAQISHSNMISK